MVQFGALNWTILITYIIVNLILGFVVGKKVTTDQDFYLGQKTTPWWAIGISVVATYVSALSFLGAPAWAYGDGLSVLAIHVNYPVAIMLVITFFFPFFYNSGVASIYEYQEKRFGKAARALIAGIWLISQSMSSAAILYATAVVLTFITGIGVVTSIVIITIVALIYTIMGGITAVIWTDVIQAVILFIGAGIIFYLLVREPDFTIADSLTQLKAQGKLNPLVGDLDFTRSGTAWSGLIAMVLYHTTVYGTNQMMVQRTLAAKNIGDAKKAYLLMGFAAFFIYFAFIFIGALFYVFYKGQPFENANTIMLQFAADHGTPGLLGIIAAAVMAASMSSLDSSFNSLSTIFTLDFYKKYLNKGKSEEHYLKVARLATLIWAVLIIFPAIAYQNSTGSILEVLSKVGSYFIGAQLGMFTLGFFFKQATEKGLLVGTAVGFITVALVSIYTDISWPWYCPIGAIANIIVTLIASYLIDGKQKEESEYTVAGQKAKFAREGLAEKEGKWYRVPGKVDSISYWLLGFFILTIIFLFMLQNMV